MDEPGHETGTPLDSVFRWGETAIYAGVALVLGAGAVALLVAAGNSLVRGVLDHGVEHAMRTPSTACCWCSSWSSWWAPSGRR